jgi:hypothetical protein
VTPPDFTTMADLIRHTLHDQEFQRAVLAQASADGTRQRHAMQPTARVGHRAATIVPCHTCDPVK